MHTVNTVVFEIEFVSIGIVYEYDSYMAMYVITIIDNCGREACQ